MAEETYQLTVTLTASAVSAAASGPDWDHQVPQVDLDLSARNTIEVLRAWLARWGALTTIRNKTPKIYDTLPVPETFKAIGEQLYRLAFPGDVGRLLERTRAKADTAGRDLRVMLHIDVEAQDDTWLSDLPWEFLYHPDPDGYFVAVTDRLVLSRSLELNHPPARVALAERPLQVHFVMTIPRSAKLDSKARDAASVITTIEDEVETAIVSRSDEWNPAAIKKALVRGVRVFHIIGVCRVPAAGAEIDLQDVPPGQSERNLVSALTKVVDGTTTLDAPQLVVLHLVEASPFDYAATFGAHARELVRRGVQAVLAMQYALPPSEAHLFTQTLYELIADGAPVDAAVREARRRFPDQNDPLFGAPVLYLQNPDGRLVQGEAPAPEPARPRPSKDDQRQLRSRADGLRKIAKEYAPSDAAFELIATWFDTIPWDDLDLEAAKAKIRARMRADVDDHGNAYIEMLTELKGETRGA